MALVLKDRIKETTTTQGTAAYALGGAFSGFKTFSEIGDTNETYYACTDGTDYEIGKGAYASSGNTLSRSDANVLASTNGNNMVSWGAGEKTIFVTQPADKAVFLNGDGNLDFENTETRIKLESNAGNSGSGDPSISIAGGGPNYIRFHDGTNFSSTTNGVDIIYRTGANDLLIERSVNGNKMAEFGGDDGHAKLLHGGTDRLETTSDGIDITGHIDFLDSTAPNYENRLRFGAGSDLQIFSDGTHGYMQGAGNNDLTVAFDEVKFLSQDYSTERLHITSAGNVEMSNGSEFMAKFIANGACELYHDDSLKLNTTTLGTKTTGIHVVQHASGFGAVEIGGPSGGHIDLKAPNSDDYDFRIIHTGSSGESAIIADDLHLKSFTGEENYIDATLNGAVNLYYDNNLRLNTTTDGVTVTGGTGPCNFVILADTDNSDEDDVAKLTLRQDGNNVVGTLGFGGAGVDNPLRLTNEYTGTGSGSGGIEIKTGSDLSARFLTDAAAELYYDNVKTFETAADGVTVKATGENSARLTLQSDDASPTDWDFEGIIDFKADDDGGTPVNYARISGRTPDVSAGTFDSYLYFHTMEDGTLAETMFLTPGGQLGLNKTNPKFTFYRPGGTTFAIDLQPPTTLRNNRTLRLPDGSGTLMLNRGDGELENTVENFQQHYISGGYLTTGEYIEIASISPTGSSRNYNISGKIMAQSSSQAQLLDINVGIRFHSTGSFGSPHILYNSSQMTTDWVEPVLWTNTSTDNIKLLIKAKAGDIHNLGVDLTLIQRAGYNDTTWNTTETPSDVTSVPSGYTEYTGEKAIGSVLNGAVELYYNNNLRLTTTTDGVKVTGGTGDATLTIEADTDNSDESDNPALVLSQDNGGTVSKLRCDGGNNTILEADTGGSLFLQGSSGENYFKAAVNGGVELYYDNSERLTTASSGIVTTSPALTNQGVYANGVARALFTHTVVGNNPSNIQYVKIATLPSTNDGTLDHLTIEGQVGGWTLGTAGFFKISFSRRNGFAYFYDAHSDIQTLAAVQAYQQSDGTVQIWGKLNASSYSKLSYSIPHSFQVTIEENPSLTTTAPSGTLAFDSSSSTYAPRFQVDDAGNLSATTKSFDIAHPTKDGMRLRYGSLEGPENGVYVRGRLTGSSVIELPEHWAGLVDEDSITVQLTAIGKSQDLWVEEVSIEQVRVCDANTDCFYMVMAERIDVAKLEVEYAN